MSEEIPPYILPALFVPFWLLLCYGISRSGWNTLAARYPSRGVIPREKQYFCSIVLDKYMNYNGCVTVGFTDTGVYLKVMPLFPFHEAILIPYEALRATGKSAGFMFQIYAVGEPGTDIAFGPYVSEWLKEKMTARGLATG